MQTRQTDLTTTIKIALLWGQPDGMNVSNALLFVALLIISGCAGIGPNKLRADRFDYTTAIASPAKENMLLNLVRLRYKETNLRPGPQRS